MAEGFKFVPWLCNQYVRFRVRLLATGEEQDVCVRACATGLDLRRAILWQFGQDEREKQAVVEAARNGMLCVTTLPEVKPGQGGDLMLLLPDGSARRLEDELPLADQDVRSGMTVQLEPRLTGGS